MPDPTAAKKKKDKKDKKEKKEKKEKASNAEFVTLEQRAALSVLPSELIVRAVAEAGLPPSSKDVIENLLSQQRASLLAAFRQRTADHSESAEAAELVENKLHASELLVAFAQLEDEVEMLHDTLAKQKSQASKARAVAEKKISEVTQLKEHIDALRDELSTKDKKHQQDLAEQQDRMVQQFNKKMENFVAKQQKNLHRDKKAREQTEGKLEELNSRIGELEQAYDLKIVEYDALQRDYEQIKLENLRRFRESTAGGLSEPNPQVLRNVVNACVVLDKITGKSQVHKTEEVRPMPNTSPAGPLPSIGRKVLF
jgi:DNA repair exonuclease SbcCD ATPase subunit